MARPTAAVASKADVVMALGDADLDATAKPANSQTMTARVMARIRSDDRMAVASVLSLFDLYGVVVNYNTKHNASLQSTCGNPSQGRQGRGAPALAAR
jgi:hypothetical protein